MTTLPIRPPFTSPSPLSTSPLRRTRVLTVVATLFLAQNAFGNLYEQNTALRSLVAPSPGAFIGALEIGSPMYYYMPWSLIGLAAAVWLVVRMHRMALPAARRGRVALGLLAVAATSKTLLITTVNPVFRDPGETADRVRDLTALWLAGNGLTILTTAAAVILLLSWRAGDADSAFRAK